MKTAFVIPAHNEENNISRVLNTVQNLSPELTIVVNNGSSDNTLNEIISHSASETHIVEFEQALGIDVPRSIGAKYAFMHGAEIIVFVDGDMTGCINETLEKLIKGIRTGSDLALVNCYPYITFRPQITRQLLRFREILNQEMGLFNKLGVAIPSHGPHAVSRKLLVSLGFTCLATPPVEMALARLNGLNINVNTAIPHAKLGSSFKTKAHAELVSETIIGDCIEAINLIRNRERSRVWLGKNFEGYNNTRRWDLLKLGLDNLDSLNIKNT